ncbi:MAG: hypothetical protein PHV42_03765 [Candidatus Pacebacteria bacterium]|nr:hypothetical protein [Candidatus Paceibacterota bacterium]
MKEIFGVVGFFALVVFAIRIWNSYLSPEMRRRRQLNTEMMQNDRKAYARFIGYDWLRPGMDHKELTKAWMFLRYTARGVIQDGSFMASELNLPSDFDELDKLTKKVMKRSCAQHQLELLRAHDILSATHNDVPVSKVPSWRVDLINRCCGDGAFDLSLLGTDENELRLLTN